MDPETLQRLTLDLAHEHDPADPVDPGPYLDAACEAMLELGIERLAFVYDSSWPEVIRLDPEAPTPGDPPPEELVRLLRAILYARLPPDFDFSQGGEGRVVVDPQGVPRARFDHVNRNAWESLYRVDRLEADATLAGLIDEQGAPSIQRFSIHCGHDRVPWLEDQSNFSTPIPLDAPRPWFDQFAGWFLGRLRGHVGDARFVRGRVSIDRFHGTASVSFCFIPVEHEETWLSID